MGDYIGTTIGVIKGDIRSLDYSSYTLKFFYLKSLFRVLE